MSKTITISIDDETLAVLNKQSKKSEFVRIAILEKAGKLTQPIEEMEKEIEYLELSIKGKKEKIEQYYNTLLKEKEERTKEEREKIEARINKEREENKEFMDRWLPLLSKYPEVRGFKGNISNLNELDPLMSLLLKDGIRIGYLQLKRFLILQQEGC